MYKDIITISTVAFHAEWGDKERNLNRILGYMEAAAKKGSDLLLLPEMALTSYDDEPDVPVAEKMQHKLAETVPGPTSEIVAAKAKELGLYVVFGMPIRDDEKSDVVYNGLAVFSPEGLVGSYHKIHLPAPEPNWATRGDKPFILDTPWGPVGIAICYDTYCFPELMDYYVAKGCRLYLNPTAVCHAHGEHLMDDTIHAQVIREGIFIASANLAGLDKDNWFWGGSSVLGPGKGTWDYHYYAGGPFVAPGSDEEAMYTATIDLSLATRFLYKHNPSVGGTDWRPDLYKKWFEEICSDESYGK
ncbi:MULTISPECIES: carbon-nitrogen hydrolase family protein [Atopobiaceae]|uniref:Predicted amidohydrolase n=1 Tax=Parafannyhessea umbonata TaxID=604330 RepID=A0A1H6I896_9ACTN|nr:MULTISPECIES: carbon-nitrogen hydrolase family protein [Atopobiaceae]SEH43898.1 Predicted amidohydrolase [Parafannyhessea umbonata]SJZ58831.1 Predicted amidohydrolase [Olsenella sp. KH1P3]